VTKRRARGVLEDGKAAPIWGGEVAITADLLDAYAEASEAFGTTDLVMSLDVANDDLVAHKRVDFAKEFRACAKDDGGLQVLEQLERPATTETDLHMAFWFLILLPDRILCGPVGCQRAPRRPEGQA
jgi:hypothetical protein